jgi:hypothetical protein
MAELVFGGVVASGVGQHATLGVPGWDILQNVPHDWPRTLFPGSLNVKVDRFPESLSQRGLPPSVTSLDSCLFLPAFEILRAEFVNNRLAPREGSPRCGDGQVWRANILPIGSHEHIHCWALRRFGSRVGEQLELVSEKRLRSDALQDNQRLIVTLFGSWRDA